tara:strand:- start:6687 stop:7643 length:957 start_codon:yes stop_codon:yes gene_type:complete
VQTDISTRRRAAIWLLFVTLIWGGTFVWMKKALDSAATHLEVWDLACVVGFMVLIRFLVAAITLPIFSTRARIALADRGAWKGGIILGLLMFGGFLTQMLALNEITPAVSAFLTSLYVVFTALIGLKMKSHPLTTVLVSGVILATFGAGFIDGPPHLTWGWAELLTVFSALLFAFHIIFTDSVTKQFDPLAVTQTSFLVVVIASTLTLIFALIFTTVEINILDLLGLLIEFDVLIWLLLLGVLGSFVAIMILNLYQRHLHPVHAAIIYAFEPVWATIYALAEGLNEATFWLFIGGGALLIGNILVESGKRADENQESE